jgi:CDP-diacylglycerol--serine O-phosphatidyltransferase
MIGFYDYTVWLTYLSAISAVVGIVASLSGTGRVDIGLMCLLVCGLCDAFDGQVARTKKSRTDSEKAFGIQIDSLSDLIAFGVLPACIGAALYKQALVWADDATGGTMLLLHIPFAVLVVIYAIYVLAALIRLAYFNVTEEERQKTETGKRKYYTGLPVTSAALIFPTFLLIQRLTATDLSVVYYLLLLLTAAAFLMKFQLKKPQMKTILIFVGIGAVEFVLFLISRIVMHHV